VTRGATILCFHGVRGKGQPDGGGIHVGERYLRDAIALAMRLGTVVPLRDLIARCRADKSTKGLVALTFDDACLSVHQVAAPIIRATGTHATIFAVRDASETGVPFWWDRLSQLAPLLSSAEWHALLVALGVQPTAADGHDQGRLARDAVITSHRGALPPAVHLLLSAAEERYGVGGGYDRAMTTAELALLAADAHFEVGVHTVTHRALPLLSDAEIQSEIRDCHDWMQATIGRVLPVLAIPYGLRDDRTAPLAARAGMEAVLRIAPRNVSRRWDAHGLPRYSMSERRSGWKLGAALLGAYEWVSLIGLRAGPGDPPMPVMPASG
jgi:peptidoglycan/xylan/chitin deacetylase (PgdA/CDA1 family)